MSSPTSKNPRQNSASQGASLAWLVVLLVLIVALGTVFANRLSIYDWVRLRGYTPPDAVVQLADQDSMKDYTRHLFYLNRPELISDVHSFRQACSESESTIVLGCYHPGEDGIYIYAVKDPKLSGVEQVTAAHEVLHAVYERLSNSDRQSLDKQLEDFYKHGLKDQRVQDEIKLYQKNEPNDVVNEMSCVFGTEVSNLPSGLEAYYGRYFSDRSKVVAYGQRYESEFTKRQDSIKQYDAQLDGLKQQIDTAEADLKGKQSAINSKQDELNADKNSGNVSSYNAGVSEYNAMVDQYNTELASTKQLVNQYNQIVQERNKMARELADLAKSLDTRLTPDTTK